MSRSSKSAGARLTARIAARHELQLRRGTDEHYEDTALYDHEYANRLFDIRWYRRLAGGHLDAGARIVELGAGTGRITVPLARDGFQVTAIDRKPEMLQALRRRIGRRPYRDRVTCVEADMRALPMPDKSAAMVIAPFNALMHLYTWQDLLTCFEDVERVLQPRGVFAFDVQLPDLDWLMWDPDERHVITPFVHPGTAERLIYSTNHRYDPETQICHIKIYYDDAPPRGHKFKPTRTSGEARKVVHLAHRQIFPEELRMLVATAGLQLQTLTSDFRDEPLGETTESQVAVCTKPSRRRAARR